MKKLVLKLLPLLDILLLPFVYPSAWLLKNVRKAGVHRLPNCRNAFIRIGVFPIRNHYYEPQFDNREPRQNFSQDRCLPGIDWNIDSQLELLNKLKLSHELSHLPERQPDNREFYFENPSFGSGDAEYWYQLIRFIRPARIFEVGSGNSTLMAAKALQKNTTDDPNYHCKHVCIEPYEMPWLEETGVSVVREKIEDIDKGLFAELDENDILFIDSSHVIRPQGDVLFEYLELLPTLKKGVIVHIHDIFSPKNYPKSWLEEEIRLWNEQYLLEAFLSHNSAWKIIGALNYLHHHEYERLKSVAPYLKPEREPGSFYIKKVA